MEENSDNEFDFYEVGYGLGDGSANEIYKWNYLWGQIKLYEDYEHSNKFNMTMIENHIDVYSRIPKMELPKTFLRKLERSLNLTWMRSIITWIFWKILSTMV